MKIVKEHYSMEQYYLNDEGNTFEDYLPVLLYKGIINIPMLFEEHYLKTLFEPKNWKNVWKTEIFAYRHYQHVAHEVMGVYKDKALLMLGDKEQISVVLEKGDVLVIPAGVEIKNLNPENSVKCSGTYDGDVNYGKTIGQSIPDFNLRKLRLPQNHSAYNKAEALNFLIR